MIRRATTEDLPSILELLADSGLPTEGVRENLDGFFAKDVDGRLVGAGGLEVVGDHALIRSLVVDPEHRGSGIATALCDRLESEGSQRGLAGLYLLTETAESFFGRRGYQVFPRGAVPAAVAATGEFESLCPDSAVCMMKELGGLAAGVQGDR